MSSSKMEMSLEDIIKTDRKDKKGNGKKPRNFNPKKAGAKKGNKNITKGKKNFGNKSLGNNTTATERLVQKLVNKALAKKVGNNNRRGGVSKKIIKTVRQPFQHVAQRSQVIKKGPRRETVVVQQVVQRRPRPQQEIIREVIVQSPVRQRQYVQTYRQNRIPKTVYVEQVSRGNNGRGGSGFSGFQRKRINNQRRQNQDPFYEPRNYLQRF